MMINKAGGDVDWIDLEDSPTLVQDTIDLLVMTPIILDSSSTPMPHCSGKIVI